MTEAKRPLEIDEDLAFQRRQFRFERIGWAVTTLLLLAALGGLFGNGPLSHATAGGAGDPLHVRYERLDRATSPTSLSITIRPATQTGSEVRLWLDRAWADGITIDSVTPEPTEVELSADRLIYSFAVQPGAEPLSIIVRYSFDEWGRRQGQIGLEGGSALTFTQFVFP